MANIKREELSGNFLEAFDKIVKLKNSDDAKQREAGLKGEKTLKKLLDTYEAAKEHSSWQALQVRLEIIKYINQLRWIDVTKASKPIQIAVFNYWNKQDLDY